MNENIIDLIKELVAKTLSKNVVWSRTNSDTEFRVYLESGVSLTVDLFTNNNTQFTDIAIYNVKGERIYYYSISRGEHYSNFNLLMDLYNAARDSYFKVDETIDSILNEIKTKKVIGTNNKIEDDDLPF